MQLPLFVLRTNEESRERGGNESCKDIHNQNEICSFLKEGASGLSGKAKKKDVWCGVSPALADCSASGSGLVTCDAKSIQTNPALTLGLFIGWS